MTFVGVKFYRTPLLYFEVSMFRTIAMQKDYYSRLY
jgi:hypothetical protein